MRVKLRVLRQLLLVLIFLLFDVCRTGDKARNRTILKSLVARGQCMRATPPLLNRVRQC